MRRPDDQTLLGDVQPPERRHLQDARLEVLTGADHTEVVGGRRAVRPNGEQRVEKLLLLWIRDEARSGGQIRDLRSERLDGDRRMTEGRLNQPQRDAWHPCEPSS